MEKQMVDREGRPENNNAVNHDSKEQQEPKKEREENYGERMREGVKVRKTVRKQKK